MKETWKARLIHLLRRSEKYTKTDMVYFMKGNFWLNVNRASSVINGLVLSVAFAHLLTKEQYGTYAFALVVLGIFSMPQSTALGAGMVKGVARGNHAIIFDGLKKVFPWSIAGGLGLATTSLYYYVMGNHILAGCFIVGSIVLPITIRNGMAKSFLSVKGDFQTLARFNLFRTPVMTAVLVISAWLTGSALVIVIANTLANVILSTLMYRIVKSRYDLTLMKDPSDTFAGKYAFHSGILSIFNYLSEKIDSLLLWKFAGAAPVAIYSYALAPIKEMRALFENQSLLALPKFAQKEFTDVKANIFLRIKQMSFIALPMIIAYVVAAPFLFKILFPQYLEAVFISQLAALSLLSSPRKLLSAAVSAHQKIKESYVMIVLPSIIRIILFAVFVPIMGIKGAVIALLTSEVCEYIILGLLMRSIKNN